nr:hypothetical protein [Fodinibius sp.]NIV14367.1 hypothetical protein [Fodinibius sp.]NIY28186.1 hypothetical protein [Fodinibius sp.]
MRTCTLSDFIVSNPNKEFNLPPVLNDFNNDGLIDVSIVNTAGEIFVYEQPIPYQSNAHHW